MGTLRNFIRIIQFFIRSPRGSGVLALCVLAISVWGLRPRLDRPRLEQGSLGGPLDVEGSSRSHAAGPLVQEVPASPGLSAASSIEDFSVDDLRAQERMSEAFESDGWSRVDAAEPDSVILEWSPEALKDPQRAETLLTQLRTQDPHSPTELSHAEQIAFDGAVDARFRRAAIEALARSSSTEAQGILLRIVANSRSSESERRIALAGLRPTSSQDAAALYLKEWVQSEKFPEGLKDEAASTWVARALLEGQDRERVLSQWNGREKRRISRIWKALTGEG